MPSGYMKVGTYMWLKKPKATFLERYCMLQSWPDYSNPTVANLAKCYSGITVVLPTLKHAISPWKISFRLFRLHNYFHIPRGHCPFVK